MKKFFVLCVLVVACKTEAVDNRDANRWKPYAGCNETQCRSWNSGCQAECMDKKRGADTDMCTNQCRAQYDDCVKSCS